MTDEESRTSENEENPSTSTESVEADQSVESDSAATFTVHEAIERAGFGKFQIILSIIGGFSWMADSMEVMLLSLLSPSLECEWGISSYEQALGTTVVFAGWMVSSPIWGRICDSYGRKKGLISASLMGFAFGVGTSFTPSFTWFLIVRTFVGIAIGGVPQAVTMCSEFLPVQHRAKCLTVLKMFWALGAAVEAVIALFVMPTLGWRWLVSFSSLPLALFALSCWWLPESARFYIAHGRMEEARKTLERVARYNGRELPKGELVSEGKPDTRITQLVNRKHRRSTLQIWAIWIAIGFVYYGITIYTTYLFQSGNECHGGQAETASNETAAGVNGTENGTLAGESRCRVLQTGDYVDIVTTSFAELPGLLLTVFIIERIGRRFTFAFQFGVSGVCTAVLIFCLPRVAIVVVLFISRALLAGAFQTSYIYTAEVYPTTMRALAMGVAGGFARIGSMATPLVAQVVSSFNIILPAIIYSIACFIAAVVAILLPIETKGRAMQLAYLSLLWLPYARHSVQDAQ